MIRIKRTEPNGLTLPGLKRRTVFERIFLGFTAILSTSLVGAATTAAQAPRVAPGAKPDTGKVRRVVVANNTKGKSFCASDELLDRESAVLDLWHTSGEKRLGQGPVGTSDMILPSTSAPTELPPGGTEFKMSTIPPWSTIKDRPSSSHRTSTIDYLFVLAGDPTLLLDEGEIILHPGDVVVGRNALHSWRNYTDTSVTLIATMVRL
jgi:mannose-6-phosphate isomerase-like protein (cupin superfamily)